MDQPRDETIDRAGGVTWRAILAAAVLLILLAPFTFYVEVVIQRYEEFPVGAVPVAALFVLTAVTSIPVLARRGLTRRELLVVYSVVVVGAWLFKYSVLFYMIPKAIIYQYLAPLNPIWRSTFMQDIPLWFSPTDPGAVETFFTGRSAVPWSLWLVPLAAWSSFMVCLFVAVFCVLCLVQRQWITNERLSFPYAQIPLQIAQEPIAGQPGRAGRLPRLWTFWVGVSVAFVLTFVSELSTRVPSLPAVNLGPVAIVQWQKVGIAAGLGELNITLWPWLIGLAYLLPKDLSFSCWFFYLVRLGLHVIAIAAGATPQPPEEWSDSSFPAPYYQATGAFIALGVWVLWMARNHLARAVRIAFSRQSGRADAQEPIPYRWALAGLLVSWLGMLYFCSRAGCRLSFAVCLIAGILGYYVMMARLRAETALAPSVNDLYSTMTTPLGSGLLRPREIITLITMRWATYHGGFACFPGCTAAALENLKISDSAGISRRRLAGAVAAGFALALVVGIPTVLTGIYHYGYFGTAAGRAPDWPSHQSRTDGDMIAQFIMNPAPPNAGALLALVAGAAVALLLGTFRLRFWWWPFHPVGYIMGMEYFMHWYVVPFFAMWATKLLVIRYGGLRLYQKTLPVAVGLMAGNMLNTGIWSALTIATQGRL